MLQSDRVYETRSHTTHICKSCLCSAERAWHKQRRHFWCSVDGASPPFGVDRGAAPLQRDSARCSSYSVSAQSSAVPGASPVSDDAPAAPSCALIELPGHMPASDVGHTAPEEPPRHRISARGAATVSDAARPAGSGHLLEDALHAACRLDDPARGGRALSMPSVGAAAAAAGATASQAAIAGISSAGLRENVSKPSVRGAAAGSTAGVPSVTAGQAAARSQRAHGLWPVDNVQNLLKGQGQPAASLLGCAPIPGSPSSWRLTQSSNSPAVRVLSLGMNLAAGLLLAPERSCSLLRACW